MHFETAVVMLFVIATTVALAARWLRVPYTVALVVAGLALGTARVFQAPHLTKELLYAVFLPGLLFEAAFHLDYEKFKQNKLTIGVLAVPGVIVAIALTALVLTPALGELHLAVGFRLTHGMVFGALIAATDPIAVVALFKSLGAPKRLAVVVEGESLLNDGTAVVLFTLILAAVTGAETSVLGAVFDFARIVGMGLLVGLAFGFGVSKLFQVVDDPMIEITLTTVAAYGAFAVAEHFHFSGVIATVASGMVCGNYGARTGMSPSTRVAVESFWEYLAFALNSVVFLLIGFSVRVQALAASVLPILVAFAAVLLTRAIVVGAVGAILRSSKERMSWRWNAVLGWGGLRGSLSMVLVLGLDAEFPHRDLLITMTYGVVVLSILLQGMTMTPLMRWLGMLGGGQERGLYERERGRLRAVRAALAALDKMEREGIVQGKPAEAIRAEYEGRRTQANRAIELLHLEALEIQHEEERAARRHLLQVEKQAVLSDASRGLLGASSAEHLQHEIDGRLIEVDHRENLGDSPPLSNAGDSGEAKASRSADETAIADVAASDEDEAPVPRDSAR